MVLQELRLLRIQTVLTHQDLRAHGLEKLEAQVLLEATEHGPRTQHPLALQEGVAVQELLEVLAQHQRYQSLLLEAQVALEAQAEEL
jgi:hypothetical protein